MLQTALLFVQLTAMLIIVIIYLSMTKNKAISSLVIGAILLYSWNIYSVLLLTAFHFYDLHIRRPTLTDTLRKLKTILILSILVMAQVTFLLVQSNPGPCLFIFEEIGFWPFEMGWPELLLIYLNALLAIDSIGDKVRILIDFGFREAKDWKERQSEEGRSRSVTKANEASEMKESGVSENGLQEGESNL
jgi:hypothetical protein